MFLLVLFRCLALSIIVFLIDYFLPLGSNPFVLSFCCSLGVILGSAVALSRLRGLGFLLFTGLLIALYNCLLFLSETFTLSLFSDPLQLYSLELQASLASISFLIGLVTTWTVIRSPHGLSIEVLIVVFSTLYFFSGHRNFNFQSPQILQTLSWSLGYSPLAVLTTLGIFLISSTLIYLRVCSGLHEKRQKIFYHKESASTQVRSKALLSTVCILGLFFIIGNSIFSLYKVEAEARTSNGVGQGKEESQSPLGFNSALGASNQPAALVRLDSDYTNNPFVPMLYLRESVLSKYNGIEMVAADSSFDKDVPALAPGSHYKREEQPNWDYRTPLIQSIFLLSDHKLGFAVDYPISINPLKNPNTDKFRLAYKVYSMAPSFSKESLNSLEVGDPAWDKETKEHYLKTNSDPRYSELAKKITADYSNPIDKANALTTYISQKAIYTLSPGHEIPQSGDQTAPFLFGDMRGYCVHFAHAMTYLLRSVGIPARVSTGYLTDLSEARDGHILLRMSDRHAWAEVFIRDRGWVPFDPKPEQVESHAESPVDMKLLEELMGLVGPDEEILPPDLTQGEAGLVEPEVWKLPGKNIIVYAIVFFTLILLILKTHLWFAWALPGSATSKIKRFYRAIVARLNDLGVSRLEGETREEFQKRASKLIGYNLLTLTTPLNFSTYSNQISDQNLFELYSHDIKALSKLSIFKKIKAGFSINSILRYLARAGW